MLSKFSEPFRNGEFCINRNGSIKFSFTYQIQIMNQALKELYIFTNGLNVKRNIKTATAPNALNVMYSEAMVIPASKGRMYIVMGSDTIKIGVSNKNFFFDKSIKTIININSELNDNPYRNIKFLLPISATMKRITVMTPSIIIVMFFS